MKIGHSLWFSNEFDVPRVSSGAFSEPQVVSDQDIYRGDLHLARLTEDLGFDSLWMPEHHFSPYCMTTNQLQLLSYVAAQTEHIELGTMVSVLPWHDPLRLAESISVLDNLLAGRRLHIGTGRGFAAREYDAFGVSKEDALERFKECLDVVRLALTRERFSFDGEFFKIPETGIRPRPFTADVSTSMYGSWTSDPVMELCAHEGLAQLHAPAFNVTQAAASARAFNDIRAQHGWQPVQPGVVVFVHCREDEEGVEEGRAWGRQSFETALWHYDFLNNQPFKGQLEGASPAERQDIIDGVIGNFLEVGAYGTPGECLRKITDIADTFDAGLVLCVFRFGQMTHEAAETSMRLFASEVMPELRKRSSQEMWATPYADVVAGRDAPVGA